MGRLDIQEITERLKNAFLPYRCDVKTENFDNEIWIQIYDKNGKPIFHTPPVPISKIEDESLLSAFIEQQMEGLETKGYGVTV